MPTLGTEGKWNREWLIEYNPRLSFENIVVVSGAGVVPTGRMLGKIATGAATSAAKAGGNTGGGTCTVDVTTPTLDGAIPGVYTARCIGLVANGGVFEIRDPNDKIVGIAYGGVAFAHQIKLVIADVGTDFAI